MCRCRLLDGTRDLRVLIQPAELIIIGGAAIGTVLVANPLHIIKKIVGGIGGVFGSSKFGKQAYIDTLKMMYELLNKARKDGLMALEGDVEDPERAQFSARIGFPEEPPHSRFRVRLVAHGN